MKTASPPCETLACNLARLCRQSIGAACIAGGLVLSLTFWLAIVGVPLALFGVALIAADTPSAT